MEEELASYSEFWKKKILRNIERDIEVTNTLNNLGWTVVRLWESDIRKDVNTCVSKIKETLFDAGMENRMQ